MPFSAPCAGFRIIAATVSGRWKVFWAFQRWYTNDPKNTSICIQCCNGINPLSVPATGAPATELCGCEDKDLVWLVDPEIFDLRNDQFELHALNRSSPWPADGGAGTSYATIVAAANATRDAMMAEVPTKPDRSGAGVCTHGTPAADRQPCCPGCSEPTVLSSGCKHSGIFGKDCTCGGFPAADVAAAPQ